MQVYRENGVTLDQLMAFANHAASTLNEDSAKMRRKAINLVGVAKRLTSAATIDALGSMDSECK